MVVYRAVLAVVRPWHHSKLFVLGATRFVSLLNCASIRHRQLLPAPEWLTHTLSSRARVGFFFFVDYLQGVSYVRWFFPFPNHQ